MRTRVGVGSPDLKGDKNGSNPRLQERVYLLQDLGNYTPVLTIYEPLRRI